MDGANAFAVSKSTHCLALHLFTDTVSLGFRETQSLCAIRPDEPCIETATDANQLIFFNI